MISGAQSSRIQSKKSPSYNGREKDDLRSAFKIFAKGDSRAETYIRVVSTNETNFVYFIFFSAHKRFAYFFDLNVKNVPFSYPVKTGKNHYRLLTSITRRNECKISHRHGHKL